jgi:hypothetical protein
MIKAYSRFYMPKKEQKKKNHHKQPQFYLKGFAATCDCPTTPKEFSKPDRSIWVYEKDKPFSEAKSTRNKNNPRCEGIENTAFAEYFYAFTEEDGTLNTNKYEDLLEQEFEQPAESVIRKIRRFEEISDEDKIIFSDYTASMIFRGDWWRSRRKKIQEHYLSPELHRKAFSEKGVVLSDAQVSEFLETLKKKIGYDNQHLDLENIFAKTKLVSIYLQKMTWRFIVVPKGNCFFTSDNPVWYRNLTDLDAAEVIFPISTTVALSASWGHYSSSKWKRMNNQFWKVDGATVSIVKNCIGQFAVKEIYNSQKAEWLVKFINNRIDK